MSHTETIMLWVYLIPILPGWLIFATVMHLIDMRDLDRPVDGEDIATNLMSSMVLMFVWPIGVPLATLYLIGWGTLKSAEWFVFRNKDKPAKSDPSTWLW